MTSKHQVVHKFQLLIAVSEVHIQIKFPCKLQLSVKIGKNQINTTQDVQLKGKLAIFEEKIKMQTLMAYDNLSEKYLEKKAIITVYVVSPRGKNVAGVLNIDLAFILNRPMMEQSFLNEALQRCPDKEANINLKIKGNLLEELIDANLSLVYDGNQPFVQSINKFQSIPGDRLKINSRLVPPRQDSNFSDRKSDRNLSQNNKKTSVGQLSLPTSNRVIQNKSQSTLKLYVKQDTSLMSQNYKLKSRIDELQREVEASKRELLQKKRLQNQVDSLSYKISQLQKVISGNRIQIDSTNKEKKREGIQLSNRVQQLQKLNVTLQKRVDMKTNFYKQELQKYNAKLVSAQNQKQQFVLQISSLRNEIFQLSRTVNGVKDKEKVLQEEKSKLLKKLQQFKKQCTEKQSTIESNNKDAMYDKLKQTISNNQVQKLSLIDQLQKLRNQVINQGVFRTKYEQQLREKNSVIQQKLFLENQHSMIVQQTTNQIAKLNKQLIEKNQEINLLNNKINEFTNRNKIEGLKTTDEIQNLKSSLQTLKQAEEKGKYQYQEINFALQQHQRQLVQITKKSVGLQSSLKQSRNQNQQLKQNLKSSLDSQKQMRIQLSKLNSIVKDFQSQLTLQTQAKRNNQGQYKNMIQKLEGTNKQLLKEISTVQDELYILKMQTTKQEQQLNDQLEGKQRILRQKQQDLRNILEEETNLQLKNAQLQSIQNQLRQNVRILELDLNKERSQNQNLKKINTTLQLSESHLKQALQQTKNNLQQKESQCESLNQSNQYLDNLLTSTRTQFQKYKQTINQHIHSLLKCLVTKNTSEELQQIQQLPQGLLKLESDVIAKVRASYVQLETTTHKLLTKEMEFIHLQQSSSLQGNTLEIQLNQLKKKLQTLKQENVSLLSTLQNTRISLSSQNQSLKKQILELQIDSSENLSSTIRQNTMNSEKEQQRIKDQYSREKKSLQENIQSLQNQISNLQVKLYEQQNQINMMNLKNYESNETIKQLEEKLSYGTNKQGIFQTERNKLLNDIGYLDQELNRMTELYENLKKNHAIALERQAIVAEQNQYLRSQFESGSKLSGISTNQFELREKSVIEIHRSTSENSRLNEIIKQLEDKLLKRENTIRVLQQNIRHSCDQIQEKHKCIYELQSQIKEINQGIRSNAGSQNKISNSLNESQRDSLPSYKSFGSN